jgi:hypothetical protein
VVACRKWTIWQGENAHFRPHSVVTPLPFCYSLLSYAAWSDMRGPWWSGYASDDRADPAVRWSTSHSQRHQDTPLPDRVMSQVTIIDPSHPLYGHTFPLVPSTMPRRNRQTLVITLPTGQQRSVPRAVTDLASPEVSVEAVLPSLAPLSGSILLSLAQQVRRLQAQEERMHEACTDLPSPRGPHSLPGHDTATALAISHARTPTSSGAGRGPTDSSPPPRHPSARSEGEA